MFPPLVWRRIRDFLIDYHAHHRCRFKSIIPELYDVWCQRRKSRYYHPLTNFPPPRTIHFGRSRFVLYSMTMQKDAGSGNLFVHRELIPGCVSAALGIMLPSYKEWNNLSPSSARAEAFKVDSENGGCKIVMHADETCWSGYGTFPCKRSLLTDLNIDFTADVTHVDGRKGPYLKLQNIRPNDNNKFQFVVALQENRVAKLPGKSCTSSSTTV